jgi:hypothetical protein
LALFYGWLDTLQPFEYEDADPAVADRMIVRLVFSGRGGDPAQEIDRLSMLDFAESLYHEDLLPAGGEPGVCPTAAANQRLLKDLAAGYCLLSQPRALAAGRGIHG